MDAGLLLFKNVVALLQLKVFPSHNLILKFKHFERPLLFFVTFYLSEKNLGILLLAVGWKAIFKLIKFKHFLFCKTRVVLGSPLQSEA